MNDSTQKISMTILETDRLLIRHLTMDDCDDLFALVSDPEIMRYSCQSDKYFAR